MDPGLFAPRKIAGMVIVATMLSVLAVQYVRALKPSALEDRMSTCRAMLPAPFNPMVGKLPTAAPNFQAVDYTGNTVSLSAYRGKTVFLNFWQTDCPPCKEEMPSMEKLQQALGSDVTVLALASETNWKPVRSFFPAGTQMTVLLDPPDSGHPVGKISRSYGTEKWPETYLIDKNGLIRYYFINSRKWDSNNALSCLKSLAAE